MIGTCIALGLWTSGLLYMTDRAEKSRAVEIRSESVEVEKNFEASAGGDVKV